MNKKTTYSNCAFGISLSMQKYNFFFNYKKSIFKRAFLGLWLEDHFGGVDASLIFVQQLALGREDEDVAVDSP